MSAAPLRYRFGPHELDLGAQRLLRDGQPLKLPSRALLLLAHLVERRHRVLGKAELLDLLAPHREADAAELGRHLTLLRRLLGEGAIATAPGRGWQFTLTLDNDTATALHLTPTRVPESAHAGALPGELHRVPLRPLLGREADLAALGAMLPERRLISIVGREGVGKTQLVSRLLAHRPGVVWVDLSHLAAESSAALASVEWVRSAIAHAVARSLGARHRAADPVADLTHALRLLDVPSLWLVFDETNQGALPHDAVASLTRTLLDAAPPLRVMWLAAHPTGLIGESVYRLPGLPLPAAGTGAEARQSPALRLLLAQARRVDRHHTLDINDSAACQAAAELVQELEGLPMALELAGARLPSLGPERLLAELRQQRAQLAARGQRSTGERLLPMVMDWTLARLTGDERQLLRQVCALVDQLAGHPAEEARAAGFTLDELLVAGTTGAAAVADALDALVELGLVQVQLGGPGEPDHFRVLGAWRALMRQGG